MLYQEGEMEQTKTKKAAALNEKLIKLDADIKKTRERLSNLKNKRAKLVKDIRAIELEELDNYITSKGMSVEDAIKKLK